MRSEAVEQYNHALKAGQKYYKNAVLHGEYPYPLVLDDIVQESAPRRPFCRYQVRRADGRSRGELHAPAGADKRICRQVDQPL